MTTQPVTPWENAEVNGLALCAPLVLERDLAKVQRLRDQQAEYLASLPTKPEDCVSEALVALFGQAEEVQPEGFEDALHLSFALSAMLRNLETLNPGPDRDAVLYVADRIRDLLSRLCSRVREVSDILGNPARLARDARMAATCRSTGNDRIDAAMG